MADVAAEQPVLDASALVQVLARTARAVAAAKQPEDSLYAVLTAIRSALGATGAALLQAEQGRLLPVAQEGMQIDERPLDESWPPPRDGGGYPVLLGGQLEGVLLLANVPAAVLSAQEIPLAALLDLAAVVLRTHRLSEERRKARQAQEIHSLERLSRTPVTAQALGLAPLRQVLPEVFAELVRRYVDLLDGALEQRAYKVDRGVSEQLRALAEEIGSYNAGPRDVIEVHTAALKQKTAALPPTLAQAYLEEGRLVALELMGHLASYYRRYAVRPWPAGSRQSGAAVQ